MVYSAFSQNLVPTPDTNRILEDLRIVKIDADNQTGNVVLFLLNRGSVNTTVDYAYIEDLSGNALTLVHIPLTLTPGNSGNITFVVNPSILNNSTIFKVVTLSGVTTSMLYAPPTSSYTSTSIGQGGGSSGNQFTITVFKFNDANLNGKFDVNESGIDDWVFALYDQSGNDITALHSSYPVTQNGGYLTFAGLDKGTYTVHEYLPSPDPNGLWYYTNYSSVTVSINSINPPQINFANYYSQYAYTLNGTVWDNTINSTHPNPTIKPGVAVVATGPITKFTFTDSSGYYNITGLPKGTYTIYVVLPIYQWQNTTQTETILSDITVNFHVESILYNPSVVYSVSGFKFIDNDNSGNYSIINDTTIQWPIQINDSMGNIGGITTLANGSYNVYLEPGNYTLEDLLPLWWQCTTNNNIVNINVNGSLVIPSFGNYYNPPINRPYNISGMVFNDTVGNGVYNSSIDQSYPGIIVRLIDSSNHTIAKVSTSDPIINYNFTQLAAGNYTLNITVPPGYYNTTNSSQQIQITNSSWTYNFGLAKIIPKNITCFVFNDTNKNGIYDIGYDNPLDDWLVYNGSAYLHTANNVTMDGACIFDNLAPGVYNITSYPQGLYWYPVTNNSLTVNATTNSAYVQFAWYYAPNPPYAVYGTVFNDTDHNGLQGGIENGILGIDVFLYDQNGTLLMAAPTNTSGGFNFTGLTNETYTVSIIVPGYNSSMPISGYNSSTPAQYNVTLTPLYPIANASFGIYANKGTAIYTISGFKFNDTNGNGIFDGTDTIMAGWNIFLYNNTYTGFGFPFANRTTTTTGYNFSGITNGTYTVIELPQVGWVNETSNPCYVNISGSSQIVNFGNNYAGVGSTPYIYNISGLVFNDTDNNGNFTVGQDNNYTGATVILFNSSNGMPLRANVTNSAGNYTFGSLPNGNYTVFLSLPTGYINTTPTSINVTINGSSLVNNNFGIYKINATLMYSISGHVFNDTNDSHTWDGNETGMGGWVILIYNGTYNGTTLPFANFTTVSGTGAYIFVNITNGIYTVVETMLAGYSNTTARSAFEIMANNSILNVDFGDIKNATLVYSISGTVYNDSDQSGSLTAGDTGLSGIIVWLNDNATGLPMAYVVTAGSGTPGGAGSYAFSSLPNGTYVLLLQYNTLVYQNSTSSHVTITVSGANVTQNFFIYMIGTNSTYTISGYKFMDNNTDGVWDNGERPYTLGWGIWLYGGDYTGGVPFGVFPSLTTTTNASGYYSFSNLPNGTYTVIELWKNGWNSTLPRAQVVLINGSNVYNISFGNWATNRQNYTIAGQVFNDVDQNATTKIDDVPIPSWSYVYINDALGYPMAYLTTNATSTTSPGNYTFSGLGNQTYRVYISTNGWSNSTPSSVYVPVAGVNIAGIDFGIYNTTTPVYQISGFKFNDTNANGVFDGSDKKLSGWTILLYQGTYSLGMFPYAITTTSSSGNYTFSGLPVGNYTVIELMNSSYVNTKPRAQYVTIPGSQNATFGNGLIAVVPTYLVSGQVFNDSDRNGLRGMGENGVSNVTVYVDDSFGLPYTTTLTNANGNYTFSLPNGTYNVYIKPPTGWIVTTTSPLSITIAGSNFVGQDFGIYNSTINATYTFYGFKYNDTNNNGVFDGSDVKLSGWAINLYYGSYNGTGTPNATVFTDTNGNYVITNLNNGTYTVVESLQPGWTNKTLQEQFVPINGADVNITFGNFWLPAPLPYSVSGIVYNDSDSKGSYLPGDIGYAGATVWLNLGTVPVANATTDANGNYIFSGLGTGSYKVYIIVPGGWYNTTSTSINFAISNQSVSNQNFGIHKTGVQNVSSIYGFVFNDTSPNKGFFDSNESGIANWTVYLFNYTTGILLSTTQTNGSGFYMFSYLPKANYTVLEQSVAGWTNSTKRSVVLLNLTTETQVNFGDYKPVTYAISGHVYNDTDATDGPAYKVGIDFPLYNWIVVLTDSGGTSYPTATLSDGSYSFTGLSGTYNLSVQVQPLWQNTTSCNVTGINVTSGNAVVDFGVNQSAAQPTYSISGYVFNDLNQDQVKQSNESMIAGWVIELTDSSDNTQDKGTNSTGYYEFDNLLPGNYTVGEINNDANWKCTTGSVLNEQLVSSNITDQYFGVYYNTPTGQTYSISGLIYNDTNRNGTYVAGDGGLANWLVRLKNGTVPLFSVITDQYGQFVFGNVTAGNYTVEELIKVGWVSTTNVSVGVQIISSPYSGILFGDYYDRYNVSGIVYFDANNDTVYDAGDYARQGWTVSLNGTTAVTDSSGYYLFPNMPPGKYSLSSIGITGWTNATPASTSFTISNKSIIQNFGYDRNLSADHPYLTLTTSEWSQDSAGSGKGYLQNYWGSVESNQSQIGIGSTNSILFTSYSKVTQYLINTGTSNRLYTSYTDPGTSPGGPLGANILALKFNVDFSNYNTTIDTFNSNFPNLRLYNYTVGTYSGFNGMTIDSILQTANQVLSGNTDPSSFGYTYADLNTLLQGLNSAFSSSPIWPAGDHLF